MSYQLLGAKTAHVSEEIHKPSSGIWNKLMSSVDKIISRKEKKMIKDNKNHQTFIPTQLRSYSFESSGNSRLSKQNKFISASAKNRHANSAQSISNSELISEESTSITGDFIIMTSITENLHEIDSPNSESEVAVPLYEQAIPIYQSHADGELPPDLHVRSNLNSEDAKYATTGLDGMQENAPYLFRSLEGKSYISVVDVADENKPTSQQIKQHNCDSQNQLETVLSQHAHALPHISFDTHCGSSATLQSSSEQFSIHVGSNTTSPAVSTTQQLSNIALFCFVLGIVCAYIGTRLAAWYDAWRKERMPRYLAKLEQKTIGLLKSEHFAQVKTLLQKELPSVVRYRGESHSDTAAFRHFLGKALLALGEAAVAEAQLRKVVDCYVGFGEDLYMAHALEDLGIAQQALGADRAAPALDTMRRALRIFTEEANAAEAAARSRKSACLFQSPDTCSPCSSVSDHSCGSLGDDSASGPIHFPSSSSTPSTLSVRRSPNSSPCEDPFSVRSSISSPPEERQRSGTEASSDALTLEFLSGDTGSIDTEGTVLEWYTPSKPVSTVPRVSVDSSAICEPTATLHDINNGNNSNSSVHRTDAAVVCTEPVQDGSELRQALEELERLLLEPSSAPMPPSAAESLLDADLWLLDPSTQLLSPSIPCIPSTGTTHHGGGATMCLSAPCTPSRRLDSSRVRHCMHTPIDCPRCPHVARVLHRVATLLSHQHRYDEAVEYLLCASEVYIALYGASCAQVAAVETDIETARAQLAHCRMKPDKRSDEKETNPSFDSPNTVVCLEIDSAHIVSSSPIKKKPVI